MAHDLGDRHVERIKAPTGPLLAAGVALLSVAAAVLVLVESGPWVILSVWPWLALAAGGGWALYWRPEVVVSDAGVRLVNVTRTIDVPWPALHAIETKWALTLQTVWGRYRAWAAPAPGRSELRRELRDQRSPARRIERRVPRLPRDTMGRPADLTHTDSGHAAHVVHERWKVMRDAGHLDTGQINAGAIEQGRPPIRWHWELAVGAATLAALGTLGLFV